MKYFRGSEWRKWDLHIHTPASINQAYGGDASWDKFIDALERLPEEVKVIGITDYYFIDGYEKVMAYKKKGRLKNIEKIFPVLEFRIDTFGSGNTTELQKINLHILFDFDESKLTAEIEKVKKEFIGIIPICSVKTYETKMLSQENFIKISGNLQKGFSEIIPPTAKVLQAAKSKTWKNSTMLFLGYKEWSNLEKNQQLKPLKKELYNDVSAFFTSNSTNIQRNQIWLNEFGSKRLLHSGDIHSFDFLDTANKNNNGDYLPSLHYQCLTWLKADPTFEGLKQCTYQPDERIYIGTIPPLLDRIQRKNQYYIDQVSVHKNSNAKNKDNWFNFDIKLNAGLVTIIGNKGSGKSAMADILALLGHCTFGLKKPSFLNESRFNKLPNRYGTDYTGYLTWRDGHKSSKMSLSANDYNMSIENVQYLPQQYIELVCNDLNDVFQNEINKVIFSYIDVSNKGDAKNLNDLINMKAHAILEIIDQYKLAIHQINSKIISLEKRGTSEYRQEIEKNFAEIKNELNRCEANKPKAIEKPADKLSTHDEENLSRINNQLQTLNSKIQEVTGMLTKTNQLIDRMSNVATSCQSIKNSIDKLNIELASLAVEFGLDDKSFQISLQIPSEVLNSKCKLLSQNKKYYSTLLDNSIGANPDVSLIGKQAKLMKEKGKIIEKATVAQKAYQKYLTDLEEWQTEKTKIEGSAEAEGTIKYYQTEIEYLDQQYKSDYEKLIRDRQNNIESIFEQKRKIKGIYSEIYSPVSVIISQLLKKFGDEIKFTENIEITDGKIGDIILDQINRNYSGIFGRGSDSKKQIQDMLDAIQFNDCKDLINFINNLTKVSKENIDKSEKRIKDKQLLYDTICDLDYVGVKYSLKVGGKDLPELSPGERGLVLLIFYLALSKEDTPIIIDQPEDNLDNESVYKKLVECICQAKKKRQVIIVTHNPNIAIACDSEQIIYCSIDKSTNTISYETGSIEDDSMRLHIINVLEGTEPAFSLRKLKYEI